MIAVRMKAEDYRQGQVKHNMEMEKKLIELENAVRINFLIFPTFINVNINIIISIFSLNYGKQ